MILQVWCVVVIPQRYKYESCGHVTGCLSIIKAVNIRNLIGEIPAFIDWRVNLKNCKTAVSNLGMQRSGLGSQMWTDVYLDTGRKWYINKFY